MRRPLRLALLCVIPLLLAACDAARDDDRGLQFGWTGGGPYGGAIAAVAAGPGGRLYAVAGEDVYERAAEGRWARIQEGAAGTPLFVTRRGAVYTGRAPAGLRWRDAGAREWRSEGDDFRLSDAEASACGKIALFGPVNTPHALAESATGTLYAAAECGLLRSNDGAAWRPVAGSPRGLRSVAALEGGVLLVRAPGRLARSADGGATWADLDVPRLAGAPRTGSVHAALATDGARAAFALVSGRLFASGDAGATWTWIPGTPRAVDGATGLALADGELVAFGGSAALASRDGGRAWADLGAPGRVAALGAAPGRPLVAVADGQVFERGASGWRNVSDGLDARSVWDVAAVGDARVATSADGLWRSADAGATWARAGFGGDLVRAGRVLFVQGGAPRRSTDGGATWTALAGRPFSGNPSVLGNVPVVAAPGGRLVALGYAEATGGYGAVRVSDDDGATWAPGGEAPPLALLAAGPDGAVFAVTGAGRLFRSNDGGASWTAERGAPAGAFTATALVASGTDVWLAGQPATGTAVLYRREGEAWAPVPTPGEGVGTLFARRDGTLLAMVHGRAYGLYASRDAGRSWTRADDGLPGRSAAGLDETDGGVLVAASQRGVFTARPR